jgi:hypothetical protein
MENLHIHIARHNHLAIGYLYQQDTVTHANWLGAMLLYRQFREEGREFGVGECFLPYPLHDSKQLMIRLVYRESPDEY